MTSFFYLIFVWPFYFVSSLNKLIQNKIIWLNKPRESCSVLILIQWLTRLYRLEGGQMSPKLIPLKRVPECGKTYLLWLINAALNDELFFSIANHTFTTDEANATYVKPFESNLLVITPGQTTNILLKTEPIAPNASFYMLARPYFTGKARLITRLLQGYLSMKVLQSRQH